VPHQLMPDNSHLAIGPNQQAPLERPLAQQFAVGLLGRDALSDQLTPLSSNRVRRGMAKLVESLVLGYLCSEHGRLLLQKLPQVAPFQAQVFRLLAQSVLLQALELLQGHGQHGVRLASVEVELQLTACLGASGIDGRRDLDDHLGEGVEGRYESLHHLQSLLRPFEGVAGAVDQGECALFEEFLYQSAQSQLDCFAVHQGQHACALSAHLL